MRNPKTTTFGLIAAIGAGVVGAIRTGIIDGSHLPDWVNAVAGLCSVVGTVGMGWFASDHKSDSGTTEGPCQKNPNPTEPSQ